MKYHTINKLAIVALLGLFFISCNKLEKMNEKTNFGWGASVTSIKDYPIEIHDGYLATKENFVTAFRGAGVEDGGWQYDGQETGAGGNVMPTMLSLTWVSYAEKKFWNIEATIDKTTGSKMLALFQEGFYNWDRVALKPKHETYNQITIAVAPGGVVVVFLSGLWHRVEIARFQAKEAIVDVNDFYDNPSEHTQQEFYDTLFGITVPKYLQEKIAKEGIPYGLWDIYREKYNWRSSVHFYKKDKEDSNFNRHYIYINGEEEILKDGDANLFRQKALPKLAKFYFSNYWSEVTFDEEEIVAVFKKMSKNHPDKNIEIEGKVAFMYKTMTFAVKCGVEEIPLQKVDVKMWKN